MNLTKVTNRDYFNQSRKKTAIGVRIGNMNFSFAYGRDPKEFDMWTASGGMSAATRVLLNSTDPDVLVAAIATNNNMNSDDIAEKYVKHFFSPQSAFGKSLYEILKSSERDALDQFEEDRKVRPSMSQLAYVMRMYRHVRKYAIDLEVTSNPYTDFERYLLALFCLHVNDEMTRDVVASNPAPNTPAASIDYSQLPELAEIDLPAPMQTEMPSYEQVIPANFASHILITVRFHGDTDSYEIGRFYGTAERTTWSFNAQRFPKKMEIVLVNTKTGKKHLYRGTKPDDEIVGVRQYTDEEARSRMQEKRDEEAREREMLRQADAHWYKPSSASSQSTTQSSTNVFTPSKKESSFSFQSSAPASPKSSENLFIPSKSSATSVFKNGGFSFR